MTPRFLTSAAGKMFMSFTETDKTERGKKLEKEKLKFTFGHARFKMLLRRPKGNVKRTVDSASL